ncbi:hypothetical protein P4112_02695 [Pseudomonas aeruginosa]|nr:hypothetical protein [Pseudomonas aeruginosa]
MTGYPIPLPLRGLFGGVLVGLLAPLADVSAADGLEQQRPLRPGLPRAGWRTTASSTTRASAAIRSMNCDIGVSPSRPGCNSAANCATARMQSSHRTSGCAATPTTRT